MLPERKFNCKLRVVHHTVDVDYTSFKCLLVSHHKPTDLDEEIFKIRDGADIAELLDALHKLGDQLEAMPSSSSSVVRKPALKKYRK